MAPSTRKQGKAAELLVEQPRHEAGVRSAGHDPADRRGTFEHVLVLQGNPSGEADPGPDTAATQAAVNAGYRPTGTPTLAGPELHADGESLVYTWTVPVLKVK